MGAVKTTIQTKSAGDVLTALELNELNQKYNNTVDVVNSYAGDILTGYGITGDGVTDDTAGIKAYIAAIKSAGGGVLYFPTGTYLFKQTLEIPSNVIFKGDGEGTIFQLGASPTLSTRVFRATTCVNYIVTELNSSGIIFRDFQLIGNQIQMSNAMDIGLGILDCNNCVVENVSVNNINYDADYVGGNINGFCIATMRANNVLIKGGRYEYGGYECIGALDDCSNVVFDGVYSGVGWRTSLQIHRGCSKVKVVNCVIEQNNTLAHAALTVHGVEGQNVTDLHIVNNHISAITNPTPGETYQVTVQLMDVSNSSGGGLIQGNTIRGNNGGISMSNVKWRVLGNDIKCDANIGIQCNGASLIDGNIVESVAGANFTVIGGSPTFGTNIGYDIT